MPSPSLQVRLQQAFDIDLSLMRLRTYDARALTRQSNRSAWSSVYIPAGLDLRCGRIPHGGTHGIAYPTQHGYPT